MERGTNFYTYNTIANSKFSGDQTALADFRNYGHYGCCENGVDAATLLALLTGM